MEVLYTIQSIISPPSALATALLPILPPRTLLTIIPALTPITTPAVITSFPALGSLFLSPLPRLLSQELALDVQRRMIAGVLPLLCSGVPGEGDLDDGQESLLADSDESLLGGLIHINNFLFSHVDDLVQSLHFPPDDLSDPKRLVHQFLRSLDSDEGFALPEEESECARDVST
jgi:hypothetical protein